MKKLGFTNCLAVAIVGLLFAGLVGGFALAVLSIKYNYLGSLVCYTAAFAPIGTACSIVLARIVDKSRAENIGGNGDGIKFAQAKAVGFVQQNTDPKHYGVTGGENTAKESPPI